MQTSTIIGVGAGIATAVGAYAIGSKITDGIARDNPTGSGADGPARLTSLAIGLVGAVGIGAGYLALRRGNIDIGKVAMGAGIGAALGAAGTAIGFNAKHGIGVETEANDIFDRYNRDFDRELDLNPMWRTPEYIRREEQRHYDSNNDYSYSTYSYYDISRLVARANTDNDQSVTRPEMLGALQYYDADKNGRLQGAERQRYEAEVGEQGWWGNWVF